MPTEQKTLDPKITTHKIQYNTDWPTGPSSTNLQGNIENAKKKSKMKCGQCNKRFKSKHNLNHHIRLKHQKETFTVPPPYKDHFRV